MFRANSQRCGWMLNCLGIIIKKKDQPLNIMQTILLIDKEEKTTEKNLFFYV